MSGDKIFSFDIRELKEYSDFVKLWGRYLPTGVRKAIVRWGQRMRAYLKSNPYPPKMTNPPQQYRRTGNLARRWRGPTKRGKGYALGNSAKYAKWVVGRETQAWMHKEPYRRTRGSRAWWTLEGEIERQIPGLVDELESEIDRQLGGN